MPHRDACFDEPEGDLERYGTLWEAVAAEPNQPWDFWKLSKHPEVPWELVVAFSHKRWDWQTLSSHPRMNFDDVRSLADKDWDWGALSDHPNVSLETIRTHPGYFWKFSTREVPFEVLIRLPGYKKNLTATYTVPWSIVLHNSTLAWDWGRLTQRKDLSWDTIQKHPDLPWDWGYLSRYREVTMTVVQPLADKPWDWEHLTHKIPRASVFQWLAAFPDKPWNYRWISLTFPEAEFHWDIFWTLKHPAATANANGWNYSALYSRTGNIDLLLRLKNVRWALKKSCRRVRDFSWDTLRRCMEENKESSLTLPWKEFHQRPDFPWELVLEFRDWPWSWWHLSAHPCLTFRFYNAHRDYTWNIRCIRSRFKDTAARRIQARWRDCVTNPAHPVCQRRLMREFSELVYSD